MAALKKSTGSIPRCLQIIGFPSCASAQVVSSSLFKRCGRVLWKHSPVHLDLKYAQWLSEGQGQISGRQMQALSPCVTGPLPFCWEINRLTITLFTSVKYGHRGSIYLPNRPLSRTKPCSCLATKSPTYTHFSSEVRIFCLIGEK